MKKRIVSLIVSTVLLVGLVPANTKAQETESELVETEATSSDAYSLAEADEEQIDYANVYAKTEKEPNNYRKNATPLNLEEPCKGEIGSYIKYRTDGEDVDWYSFYAKENALYHISLDDYCEDFQNTTLIVELFNPKDEYESISWDLDWYGRNDFYFWAQYTGTHYIKMYNYVDYDTKTSHPYVIEVDTIIATYNGNTFYMDGEDVRCKDSSGKALINTFACDGTFTYYFQADGTAMKDRLTYHPDGKHVIYFDSDGHEVFSDFAYVSTSIAGKPVDDYCFFDVHGYLYVDVVTWDKSGTQLLYANAYGRLECDGWFQFSSTVKWADGKSGAEFANKYGYGCYDCTLLRNCYAHDWLSRYCYLQGNGVALYNK